MMAVMAVMLHAIAGAAEAVSAGVTVPDPVSPERRALICAAVDAGDAALAQSIVRLVARTDPAAAAGVEALGAAIAGTGHCPALVAAPVAAVSKAHGGTQAAAVAASSSDGSDAGQKLASAAGPVKGQLEFGLGQTTGGTDTAAVNVAASLSNEARGWRQTLSGAIDYQRIEGFDASERYAASYDVRRDLSRMAFVSGLVSLERDPRAGFSSRSTQSLGFGAKLGVAGGVVIDLSGGPSLRHTDWVGDRRDEAMLGARGSAALAWTIAPGFSFAASTSGIFEAQSGTIEGQASITGKLIGPLATRLQFSARHETNAYPGLSPTTTSSRASIVYAF